MAAPTNYVLLHRQPSWSPSTLSMLHTARQALQGAGIVSYACDAEILLMFVLGVSRIDLYANDLNIDKIQKQRFETLIERRASGEPPQYIIGRAEFFGLEFLVDPSVFIPRPETEILVEAVLKRLSVIGYRLSPKTEHRKPNTESFDILDLCTGSGCIAISLAKYAECGKIIATDISQKAIKIAKKNAVLNGVDGKIEFKQANLFEGLDKRFDIIVSNPPYIKRTDFKKFPVEVSYEPQIALDGGEDGLDFYKKICSQAPEFLKENGVLVMELGDGHALAVKKMFLGKMEIVKDLNGIERVLTWTKSI